MDSDPVALYRAANCSAREALLCARRGEGTLALLHRLNARALRDLARSILQ